MTRKGILALLSAGLLVYTPLPQPASAGTATLGQVIAKGDLKINGATAPSGATVYSGDEVGTGTNAEAELVFPGGEKVLLPQTSAVALNNEAGQVIVNLKQGSLAVLSKSASPVFVDTNGVRIKPAANTAIVMEVAVAGNSFKVLMRRGSAAVEASSKTLNVPEGRELEATTASDPPAPAASPQVPVGGTSSLATWELVIAAAAGVTGLILGAVALSRPNARNCKAVSPAGTISCP